MSTADPGRRSPGGRVALVRSRRWLCLAGTAWSLLAALAVYQWVLADDSRGRWLAGVQFVLAIALAIGFFVQARTKADNSRPILNGPLGDNAPSGTVASGTD